MMLLRASLATALLALLAGCSGWGNKTNEYKGAAARASQPLEVPPELTTPSSDDRFAIPDPRAQTAYSQYSQRTPGAAPSGPGGVLPPITGARMERTGDQRWLVVKGDPNKVWQVVRDFWIDSGYTLARETPEVGIMETDWYEDRSRIPQDIVRRTIGRVIDGMYSTARRDKFRTRLEKGTEAGTTEVFVSNRQVEEVLNVNQDSTKWTPRAADRELEAEMLSRILARISSNERVAAAAPRPPVAVSGAPLSPTAPQALNAVLENSGGGPLVVNDGFDRAWRRVGLALDRVGFTVEDRDRSKGLFFVRYIDPEADAETRKKNEGGFVDKLMFWRTPPKSAQPQYRIYVADAGAGMSQVTVQNSTGGPEASSTGKRILTLLFDQLK